MYARLKPSKNLAEYAQKRKTSLTVAVLMLVYVLGHSTIATASELADTIYFNGNIYTVDVQRRWVEAVAIESGRFLAVSDNETVMHRKGPDTTLIDLNGRMVMPGIHDGHQHLLFTGLINTHYWCYLPYGINWRQASQILKVCASKLPEGEWLVAYSYDQHWFEDGIHTSLLDEVIEDRPFYFHRWDSHIGTVNSRGLTIALQDGTDKLFAGGRIVRDASGKPTGELAEGATWLATRHLPTPTEQQLKAALRWSIVTNNRYGIVSTQEASATRPLVRTLQQLDLSGQLSLYVSAHLVWWNENYGFAYKPEMDALIEDRRKYRSPNLGVDFIKLWLDGDPVEPHSILVELQAKSNLPEYTKAFMDQETLNEAVKRFDQQGIQMKMHASGAGAARMVLDAVEQARRANPQSTLRHELAHATNVSQEDRRRLKPLRVTADMSPEIWIIDKHGDLWPMRDLDQLGALVTLGSDSPFPNVQGSNPFRYLADAMVRTKEGISLETGIKMMTINGAIAVGREEQAGSIEQGKWADMIILDRNLFETPVAEIKNTKVLKTLYKGDVVYDAVENVISTPN